MCRRYRQTVKAHGHNLLLSTLCSDGSHESDEPLLSSSLVKPSTNAQVAQSASGDSSTSCGRPQCDCRPEITVNPVYHATSNVMTADCNCTAIREIVSDELKDLILQLERLQQAVSGIQESGWRLVFKGVAGTGINLYDLWTGGTEVLAGHGNYRNDALYTAWEHGQLNIKRVKLSVCGSAGCNVELVFKGEKSDTVNWFFKRRLLSSSWSDLNTTTATNFFSVAGHINNLFERRFFINKSYNGCSGDFGWLVVLEDGDCEWETSVNNYPLILYSTYNTGVNWQEAKQAGTLGVANYLTIHVEYQ